LNGKICLDYTYSYGGIKILWSNGVTTFCLEDVVPGAYTATVTSAGFCSVTLNVTVPFALSDQDKNGNDTRIDVFPNPVTDALIINLPLDLNSCKLSFYDVLGRQVCTKNLVPGYNKLALENMVPGIYTFHIWDAGKVLRSGKVVKM